MDPTPVPSALAGEIQLLTDLGLLPYITLGAVIFVAYVLYRRFRK